MCLSVFSPSAEAYWVWSPVEGKFVSPEATSKRTAEEQFDYALQLQEEGEHDQVEKNLKALVEEYPNSSYAAEAQYKIAVAQEEKGDYGKFLSLS